jgi:AcrR family transcriptional regulator
MSHQPVPTTKNTQNRAHKLSPQPHRRYHSPLRQQQSVETRDRIVTVGAVLARNLPSWDWRGMTFKAVSERAHMNERTVRRYFTTERALRDAIQQRLLQECGVDFERLELADFADAATRVHLYLSGFACTSNESSDPGFTAMDTERRTALLESVTRATPSWTPADRLIAAATFDFFWTPTTFERLTSVWQLDQQGVGTLIRWFVMLLHDAIKEGKRPEA